jgi:hypothetical protein
MKQQTLAMAADAESKFEHYRKPTRSHELEPLGRGHERIPTLKLTQAITWKSPRFLAADTLAQSIEVRRLCYCESADARTPCYSLNQTS